MTTPAHQPLTEDELKEIEKWVAQLNQPGVWWVGMEVTAKARTHAPRMLATIRHLQAQLKTERTLSSHNQSPTGTPTGKERASMAQIEWTRGYPVIATDNTMDGAGKQVRGHLVEPGTPGHWMVAERGVPGACSYRMTTITPDHAALAAGERPAGKG